MLVLVSDTTYLDAPNKRDDYRNMCLGHCPKRTPRCQRQGRALCLPWSKVRSLSLLGNMKRGPKYLVLAFLVDPSLPAFP